LIRNPADMSPVGPARALSGIQVVDLSRVLAGPYCTQILSDHGADVIKVEPPGGDETRTWGPPFEADSTGYYRGVNRNKRSICLDLSTVPGREVLSRMLIDADIVVENFKIGTMQRWGLGYEEVLRARFPKLIYCRISGFGAAGPLGGAPGYDAVVQAMSGLMSINGDPHSGPTRIGVPMVDLTTGLNAVIGILLALTERQRSGLGQFIDLALYDTALSLLHPHAANWFMNGRTPHLQGSGHPNIVPYDKFRTRTGEMFLGVGNDGQFRKFCSMVGAPELADDPRFASNGQRSLNRDELRAIIERLLAGRELDSLCRGLLDAGVPAGPVNSVPDALNHPQTAERHMIVELGRGQRGTGVPVKLSRTPGAPQGVAPRCGEHTREILQTLGYSQSECGNLEERNIVRHESILSTHKNPATGP
jgi:crotonobetainyl-CoA:carnitine CoA-transferase CaiB-like acyl-CoA transferase